MPIDLAVPRAEVAETIREMIDGKQLNKPMDSEEVLRDALAIAAYQEVSGRPELLPALQKAQAAVRKWGF